MKWMIPVLAGVYLCGAGQALAGIQVKVDAGVDRVAVGPDLYGIFYEEINHAGDGGLYAEMVLNGAFEENVLSKGLRLENGRVYNENGWSEAWKAESDLHGWSAAGGVQLSLDDSHPLNAQSPHSMKVVVKKTDGKAGFANTGYWGMSVVEGNDYLLTFFARGEKKVPLRVALESADGKKVYAEAEVQYVGGAWNPYECTLTSNGTDPKARLVITFSQPATLWFDVVSMFPRDTYKGRIPGMRKDLMGKLEELQPKFLRFPGGCVVEGASLDNRVQWKKTIGPMAERPGNWNLWGYHTLDGLGFHEFLQMAEDLGAESMYVCNIGLSCQNRKHELCKDHDVLVDEYVQDTLDALEYAMGPATSTWGALRARNGHPEPFKIKYVEIGNENFGADYQRAYRVFYDAIKAQYPEVITISNEAIPGAPVEMIDEHYYVAPDWFFLNADLYDDYDRSGPKIYVGEYAVNRNVGSGNLLGALSEAAFMMGMENNSDIVKMASYAPLFENVNDRRWAVNLIRFDSSRVIGRSSFYVQKMFSEHLPTEMVKATVSGLPKTGRSSNAGGMGLNTWLSDASFKDIRVTQGDKVLYESDFGHGAGEWKQQSGTWVLENGEYRQTNTEAKDAVTVFGDESWSNYTIELKARHNQGEEGFMVVFRHEGQGYIQWNLGGWGNTKHAIQAYGEVVAEQPGSIKAGRWYDVKIVLKGYHVDCYLDGQRIHSVEIKREIPGDFFANAGIDGDTGEMVVKMVNASAKGRDVAVNLNGYGEIDPNARVVTLCGTGPKDENSLEEPTRVAPVESTFDQAGRDFIYPVNPWSVTILRMKTSTQGN